MLTFQSYCWDASKRTCPSHDHSLHSVPCQSVAQSSENCRSECEEELWRCAAGAVLSLSTPACGHLRAPLLYTARSAGDASQDLPPYWPASQLSLMHLNALVFFLLCCCCGRRGAGWWGAAHHPISKFCAPACFLCHTMRLTERSSQNISIRGDPHPSAHWIGFLSQGPPVDLRHGVVMSWMWCIRRGDKGARRGV